MFSFKIDIADYDYLFKFVIIKVCKLFASPVRNLLRVS